MPFIIEDAEFLSLMATANRRLSRRSGTGAFYRILCIGPNGQDFVFLDQARHKVAADHPKQTAP